MLVPFPNILLQEVEGSFTIVVDTVTSLVFISLKGTVKNTIYNWYKWSSKEDNKGISYCEQAGSYNLYWFTEQERLLDTHLPYP